MSASTASPPRLAAIVFTDAVGYSTHMGRDEQGTITRLQADFEAFRARCGEFGGEVLNTTGDGMLLAFPSGLQAVTFALGIQEAFGARKANASRDQPLMHRIGIHVGDVYRLPDGTVAGDGVNIASRLEAKAPEGGICVSQAVYDMARGRVAMRAERLGEERLKNIAEAVVAWSILPEQRGAAMPSPHPKTEASIAVLPFVNMSADPENEYFSDGLSEELLNVLVKVTSLKVIARTSSFAFKGKSMQVRDIAKALGVEHVLEGSVRKAGNRVRVTAQLIRAGDDAHLWSETYDRTLDDIFAVQDDISQEVVAALKVKLAGPAPSVSSDGGTHDVAALEHYFRGRHLWEHSRGEADLRAALAAFEAAVALDPRYARAHVRRADVLLALADLGYSPLSEALPEVEEALAAALRVAPRLGDALATRGYIASHWRHDVASALADHELAVQLAPGEAFVHRDLAHFHAACGRIEAAIAAAEKALSLDPYTPSLRHNLARIFLLARRYADTEAIARALVHEHGLGHAALGMSLLLQGRPDEALAAFDGGRYGMSRIAGRGCVHAHMGREQEALAAVAELEAEFGAAASYQCAQVFSLLGKREEAIAMLERARDVKDAGVMAYSLLDPFLDGLRAEPRFIALLEQLGLKPAHAG